MKLLNSAIIFLLVWLSFRADALAVIAWRSAFHNSYVVGAVARSAGLRLRLRPLYREYLAQAFARYFMRVSLPLDANAFEAGGQV